MLERGHARKIVSVTVQRLRTEGTEHCSMALFVMKDQEVEVDQGSIECLTLVQSLVTSRAQ